MRNTKLARELRAFLNSPSAAVSLAPVSGSNHAAASGGAGILVDANQVVSLDPNAAGAGLTYGGGILAVGAGSGLTVGADSVALTTPGTLTAGTSNSAAGSHTHAITASADVSSDGAGVNTLLKSLAGGLTLKTLEATTRLRAPLLDTASGNLSLAPASGYVTLPADGVLNTASGGMSIVPAGDLTLNPGGSNVLPGGSIEDDLGDYNRKWRTLFAAELYVETLVAQDVLATIGGRILVAPTTTLIANLSAGAATADVKHNIFANGDYAYMASAPGGIAQVEVLKITSAATPVTGGYRYSIARAQDGSPANAWVAGDALAHIGGAAGEGYFDITATQTIHNHFGPTIIGYVRTGSEAWNTVKPVTAQGNLRSFVDYAADEFGFATGNDLTLTPTTGFKGVTVDRTDGARFFNTDILLHSGATLKAKIQSDGQFFFGSLAGARLQWDNTDLKGVNASNAVQWYGRSTDGRFYASGGKTYLDARGLGITIPSAVAPAESNAVSWRLTNPDGDAVAKVGAWSNGPATVIGLDVGGTALATLDNNARFSVTLSGTYGFSSIVGGATHVMGNLGVGLEINTAPAARLHVHGNSPSLRLSSDGANETITLSYYDNNTTLKGRLLYVGGNPENSRYFGLANDAADFLGLYSATNTRIYGAVGIGRTEFAAPGTNEYLRVSGGSGITVVRVDSSHPNNGPVLKIDSTATNGRVYGLRSSQGSDTGGAGKFQILDYTASAVRWTMDSSGNIEQTGALTAKGGITLPADNGVITFYDRGTDPPAPDASNRVLMYLRDNKFFIVYRDTGDSVTRYRWLDLENTTGTWNQNTTAPAGG